MNFYSTRGAAFLLCGLPWIACLLGEEKIDMNREANTVILDKTSAQNLGIETELVSESKFETTVFAIGRVEESPHGRSVIASRVPGRIVELNVCHGDLVEKGAVVATIESRVYGDPPPKIQLKALERGIVTDIHVHLGQPVEPENELFVLSDRSTLWTEAKIPESEAGAVKIGSRARIRIPALGEGHVEAQLIKFGTHADRDSGSVIGIFEIPNPDGRIQPGMRAEFSIITKSREGVMAVPVEAIQGDPAKRLVFVKDFEIPYAFVRSPVVLGERNDKDVEILSGLFPGDEVVTRGSYALSFAGGGSGLSLREALDLAHGHEHNADGSEMTPEQKAAREKEKAAARGETSGAGGGSFGKYGAVMLAWAALATLALLAVLQMYLSSRRRLKDSLLQPKA